jgi:hypothetical protein
LSDNQQRSRDERLDGADLVVLGDTQRLRAADRQRLAAKARQKGSVIFPVK